MTAPPKASRTQHAQNPDGTPNWEWIEHEYRVGQLSIRAIGRASGISEAYVRKRAKEADPKWERDLTDDVRKKVRSAQTMRSATASDDGEPQEPPGEPLSDEEIVELAAARTLTILGAHRKSIQSARQMVDSLITDMVKLRTQTEEAGNNQKPVGFDALARAMRSFAGALKDLIPLERQAMGLGADNGMGGDETPDEFVPLSDRLAMYNGQRRDDASAPAPQGGPGTGNGQASYDA